jgi:hypothetical protein
LLKEESIQKIASELERVKAISQTKTKEVSAEFNLCYLN